MGRAKNGVWFLLASFPERPTFFKTLATQVTIAPKPKAKRYLNFDFNTNPKEKKTRFSVCHMQVIFILPRCCSPECLLLVFRLSPFRFYVVASSLIDSLVLKKLVLSLRSHSNP